MGFSAGRSGRVTHGVTVDGEASPIIASASPERPHGLKYRWHFGRDGLRIVGYDNERGKGDHRHYRDVEAAYQFVSVEKLVADFLEDVETASSEELDTLSPKRLELLRHVRMHGARNDRDLAQAVGRDYKNVHQDVQVLQSAVLRVKEGRKLSAPWDELRTSMSLTSS